MVTRMWWDGWSAITRSLFHCSKPDFTRLALRSLCLSVCLSVSLPSSLCLSFSFFLYVSLSLS